MKLKNQIIGGISLVLAIVVVYCGVFNTPAIAVEPTTEIVESNENSTYFNYGTAGITSEMLHITKDSMSDQLSVETSIGAMVQASYEANLEPEIIEPVIEEKRKEVSKEYYVSATKLNCRRKPNTDSEIVDTLGINDKVKVTQKVTIYIDGENLKHTWYKLEDKESYIRSDFLSKEPVLEYLGDYRITYYCNCPICCGKWSYTTASGDTTVEGVTCAADPSIPFGTKLLINGHIYTVQDRGGAIKGKHIDIYVSSHEKALHQTYTSGPVYKVP